VASASSVRSRPARRQNRSRAPRTRRPPVAARRIASARASTTSAYFLRFAALLQAVGVDHAAGELDEGLGEHTLGTVALDNVRIDRGVVERLLACGPMPSCPASASKPFFQTSKSPPHSAASAGAADTKIKPRSLQSGNPWRPLVNQNDRTGWAAQKRAAPIRCNPVCPWQNTGRGVQLIILRSPSTTFSRSRRCR
jgi:hypothetical protein